MQCSREGGGGGEDVDKAYVIKIVTLKVKNMHNGLTRLLSELRRNLSQKDTLTERYTSVRIVLDPILNIVLFMVSYA
jgi:hypothetical protein